MICQHLITLLIRITKDICIIGGGIIGTTITRALSKRFPNLKIGLFEKENLLGQHGSTRNSSVIHSGLYYSTDSLKARFCKQGNEMLTQFCIDNKLPLKNTGKLVMASNDEEYERLKELKKQAELNEIDYEWMNFKEASSIEKNLKFHKENYNFLFTPTTKVGDNKAVIDSLEKELKGQKNVSVFTHSKFVNIYSKDQSYDHKFIIQNTATKKEEIVETKYLINCAGLYADKIAKQFQFCSQYTILPFKGHYLIATQKPQHPVSSLIYPIPPKKGNYFLGVHLTVTVDDHIKFGPSALPALYREQYGDREWKDIGIQQIQECSDLIQQYILNILSKKSIFYLKHFIHEMKKLYTPHVVQQAMNLCTIYDSQSIGLLSNTSNLFYHGRPGIRAQLVNLETRELVNDFIIEKDNKSMHLLNVVSPGWTCSMPIAEHVTDLISKSDIKF